MAKSARKPTPSTIVNRTVPRRGLNSKLRPREYLTEKEIERLQEAARKRSRYGHRDATMRRGSFTPGSGHENGQPVRLTRTKSW
jgi:hypothetical protein